MKFRLNHASSRVRFSLPPVVVACVLASFAVIQSGCLGLTANLMHAVGADMEPADYEGLEESKVAIVTTTESSHYRVDKAAPILSKSLGAILTQEVHDLRLVRHSEVEEWRDRAGWESVDFVALGKAVGADKVVSINLDQLKLRDGQSLFRGSADVTVTVIDVESESVVYTKEIVEHTFPRNAGQPVTETTEARFQKLYLGTLAREIGRLFHKYDYSDLFALDGAIASQ